MATLIKQFKDTGIGDVAIVGGKNASLGEMCSKPGLANIPVPDGFAITAMAFADFLAINALHNPINEILQHLDRSTYSNLADIGSRLRLLLSHAVLPPALIEEIIAAYHALGNGHDIDVAVRSSATAEDLPQASFAGQHESFLNVRGKAPLLKAIKNCFASLFTDRAIKYREDNGFAHEKVLLSVGVQKMIRADKGCSGVAFTLEPESGFRNVIHISGVWGLGENIVQGAVTPDEFLVFKPSLVKEKYAIIQKRLGEKAKMMIYSSGDGRSVENIQTPVNLQQRFVLTDEEITKLAKWCMAIEQHYHRPMDIEWAKDGITGNLFILQARPETVQAKKNALQVKNYILLEKSAILTHGEAIGNGLAAGRARILQSPSDASKLEPGDILVTTITSPDWDPVMKKVAAIVTDKGGRTSHAAIVARELGLPAIVGCGNATGTITDGDFITVCCNEGKTGTVYRGSLAYKEQITDLSRISKPRITEVKLITADPDQAFRLSFYPNDGVGLMRLEFIIARTIKIHPMALVKFNEITDNDARLKIEALTAGYADKQQYFTEKLAGGIATMAAAFYPKDVIVRMSDFKTNEYANLIGGKAFEPTEENPMIGFRGASRYYHPLYREGFRLECEAVRKVRDDMGLTNVKLMIPFCRTPEEGSKVIEVMKNYGLAQGRNGLEIYMMAEIPSNVLLASRFAEIFDGFSIGSNDLTQLTLGIDRDSSVISGLFDERDEAATLMIEMLIRKAKDAGIKTGICGQAPSDYPQYAQMLAGLGIDSISFNPDALLKGIENVNYAEEQMMADG
ncbi:phosphoenolpyruvate synthase [Foetidibacter luteolus]|uniref:phosphoenolpyruvate synthase n=1 Tax=Foetidibacter luteolus TaxID=2608880 RepID=UPI00129BC530|nr:phosphoenolpyruvate synthase [Foetidibacter luteolus]